MSDGFLSQEEINSLLSGNNVGSEAVEEKSQEGLEDIEKDLLGEIGNISMGSASTALSTIIGQQVNITTPVVSMTTLRDLRSGFQVPNVALDVQYTSGIVGENLLVMKVADAGVIASLMMGGDGKVQLETLSELELSAVSEAMNQMIGSAATSMATMLSREVNISPPTSEVLDNSEKEISSGMTDDETIVQVSFKLTIGDLVDSKIMQVLPIKTAKKIVSIMMGNESKEGTPVQNAPEPKNEQPKRQQEESIKQEMFTEQPPVQSVQRSAPVEVAKAAFQPLSEKSGYATPKNIDLILDVPLEISVVLGRTKKNIKEILNLGTGSLVELDKLAEEPVEVLVNGKKVAYGEVVVVDENFGVRITSIVSSEDRVRSLAK